jgi:hypothetical protein
MKKTFSIERVSGIADYRLPPSMSREIGRIIVHWSYFEYCVQEMNWQALGVTPAAGRVAVRAPRVTDRLEMLRDLIKLREGEWDNDLFKSILDRSKLVEAKRNLVTHGIWGHREDGWYVELSRGAWPKNLRELIAPTRVIQPEFKAMSLEKLREATTEISELIGDLKRLRASAVGPSTPSPDTPR